MKASQGVPDMLPGQYHWNIETLRGKNGPEALKAVAKEMESLFAYEMLKAMRSASKINPEGGLGSETYMSMFDMELARILADRGLGLQDMLLKGLGREAVKSGGSPDGAISGSSADAGNGSSSRKSDGGQTQTPSPAEGKVRKEGPSGATHGPVDAEGPPSLPVEGVVSSRYGMRKHPIYATDRFHRGVDLAAPAGTEIRPVRKGKVIFSGQRAGYGNMVIVDHGNGLISKYAHNKENLVKKGDEVDENSVIATVGSTGLSTGPHVHFEVRYHGESLDPLKSMAAL